LWTLCDLIAQIPTPKCSSLVRFLPLFTGIALKEYGHTTTTTTFLAYLSFENKVPHVVLYLLASLRAQGIESSVIQGQIREMITLEAQVEATWQIFSPEEGQVTNQHTTRFYHTATPVNKHMESSSRILLLLTIYIPLTLDTVSAWLKMLLLSSG